MVGRVGDQTGEAAFAISINSSTGVISVAQYLSLNHGDSGDPDDTETLASSVLFADVTVTDGDSDTDTASVDIGGQVAFDDDGPTAAAALTGTGVTRDESAGTQETANE